MLRTFTIVGIAEGISYLVLLANMMITKNMDIHLYEKLLYPIGMSHGVLFIGYVVLAMMLKVQLGWSFKKFMLIFIASLIPFGTFYSERNWVHQEV